MPVPKYLTSHYWWAYVHPKAVRLFERQWLVNLILWGNYRRLSNAVLASFDNPLQGKTLQVACAYGDLTPRLATRLGPESTLDVVDILPIQLLNLRAKIPSLEQVHLRQMDSSVLSYDAASFDRVLLFFLLHEQPLAVRQKTLAEAVRVLKPGGTLTIVDYAQPRALNPLRYLWCPVLERLEPFARDLFTQPVEAFMPAGHGTQMVSHQSFFGGLYQLLEYRRPA